MNPTTSIKIATFDLIGLAILGYVIFRDKFIDILEKLNSKNTIYVTDALILFDLAMMLVSKKGYWVGLTALTVMLKEILKRTTNE